MLHRRSLKILMKSLAVTIRSYRPVVKCCFVILHADQGPRIKSVIEETASRNFT